MAVLGYAVVGGLPARALQWQAGLWRLAMRKEQIVMLCVQFTLLNGT